MSITASEIGALAAENVAKILEGAGDAVEAQLAASAWATSTLADGGWTALTAADSDADLTLRDLQQIARVGGRFLVPQALTTTLLAGRWFGLGESELARGVTVAVPSGDTTVLPYAVGAAQVVDATGQIVGELTAGERDGFSAVMPLAPASPSVSPIGPSHRNELSALLAATATGCADAVLDRAVGWVQTRHQFGRPLAAFQAIRHHLADMHIAREEAWTCAIAAGEEPDRAAEWAWTATQRAKTVIETGIQVHGGIGFTWEAGIHHWLRHVLQLESLVEGQCRTASAGGPHLSQVG